MTISLPSTRLKIGPKLIAAFLVIGIVPFAVIGLLAVNKSSDALNSAAFDRLESVRAIKKAQMESFFAERQSDMGVLVETVSTLRQEAFAKLTAVREIKKNAIESYFQHINDQVITFSENGMIVDAMRTFAHTAATFRDDNAMDPARIKAMRESLAEYYTGDFATEYVKQNGVNPPTDKWLAQLSDDAVALQHEYIRLNKNPLGSKHILDAGADPSRYSAYHKKVHPTIRNYLEKFGYYDIFLVEPTNGTIVYSVFKELDFGTSLISGPWSKTNFADAFKRARALKEPGTVALVDYKLYTPSYDAPAGFIASPIFENGQMTGVLVFQMPLDKITSIMGERAGLGKTGETYLVGPDQLMRSDSYLDPKYHTVTASFRDPSKGAVLTEASKAALAGKSGADIVLDYNNNPVLSSYTPVKVGALSWGLLAEIDVAEAFVPIDASGKDYFAKYIEKYGYYDLFLMNPNGYVFYSATHEADYQTNMVNGPYKDSGLGKLTRDVLASKKYGVADFAPYGPSNNDPAGFIAQPVISKGKTELIVALQLSLDSINHIMQQREGMGQSGESYLVGPDKLMRSDSFLDQVNHTVKASFANPKKGSVNSVASNKALAGETGSEIVIDYNGNPVLSAYTQVQVGEATWALMAEIDESEAFAPIRELQLMMLVFAAVGILAIAGCGFLMARSLSGPIKKMTDAMGALAGKNLEVEIPGTERRDEIGEMANAVQVFKENMIRAEDLAEKEQLENQARHKRAETIDQLLNTFKGEVNEALSVVLSASTELEASSQSMSTTAEQTSHQASAVAAAANQAAANVATVASAAEELGASGNEISRQISESETITKTARSEGSSANDMIQGLSRSVNKIGDVVSLINDIAEQTNLLALNATIEAARAGDAGKGFAVVASEVKNLANQTAKATEEITGQVTEIQQVTERSVAAIGNVSDVIEKMGIISSSISAAVEQQGSAVQEIVMNVHEVSAGTSEVTKNITGVSVAANETGGAANEVLKTAQSVAQRSNLLRDQVDSFLNKISAV